MLNPTWKNFLYTGVLCFGIAVVLTLLVGSHFGRNLIVSLSIGLSINGAFRLLEGPLSRFLHPYVAPIPIIAIGLSFGLTLGGGLITRNPWFFFTQDYSSIILGVFFTIIALVIFTTRDRLTQTRAELNESLAQQAQQEKVLAETELKLLQAQIEPHFLFNTLSNIVGLVHSNPDAAETTLIHLTTLLRASLNRTRSQQTTLAQELDIAKAYLEIHKIRMTNRLEYSIECDPIHADYPLPPLIVQPLIENAIKHGIDPLEEGGSVQIKVSTTREHLEITVTDDGRGFSDHAAANGTSTGLENVRNRLSTLFDGKARLILRENEPHGAIANLKLPREPARREMTPLTEA